MARIPQSAVRGVALSTALLLGLTAAAFAHGPTRQKVSEQITIDAAPDKVWAVVGNFQDMSWFPAIKATTGEGGNTPDVATRQLDLGGGATIDEALYKYDAAEHMYAYRITKVDVKVLPVNNYSSSIEVKPEDGGKKSVVAWRGAFYRGYPNNDPPPELSDEAAIKAVTGIYKAGLEALKKKVESTN